MGVHWDSNSQGGSSLASVRVHSLTLSFTPELPLLAYNLVSPCLGHELKARVATLHLFPPPLWWSCHHCDKIHIITRWVISKFNFIWFFISTYTSGDVINESIASWNNLYRWKNSCIENVSNLPPIFIFLGELEYNRV